MCRLFFQNHESPQGSIVPEHFEDEIEKAITLHLFKDHKYMYRLKQYLHQVRQRKLKAKMTNLTDCIKEMNNEINASGNKFAKPSGI